MPHRSVKGKDSGEDMLTALDKTIRRFPIPLFFLLALFVIGMFFIDAWMVCSGEEWMCVGIEKGAIGLPTPLLYHVQRAFFLLIPILLLVLGYSVLRRSVLLAFIIIPSLITLLFFAAIVWSAFSPERNITARLQTPEGTYVMAVDSAFMAQDRTDYLLEEIGAQGVFHTTAKDVGSAYQAWEFSRPHRQYWKFQQHHTSEAGLYYRKGILVGAWKNCASFIYDTKTHFFVVPLLDNGTPALHYDGPSEERILSPDLLIEHPDQIVKEEHPRRCR